ncbi:MAG TPA: TonB family protein [Candidatus Saccharimonadales bacterium]|jgi:protein TonB|nr:TonB family protein [Candidatus Saccharimonadales bacterium]
MSLQEPQGEESPQKQPGEAAPEDQDQTAVIRFAKQSQSTANAAIIPSLFGPGYGSYEVRPENFLLSLLTHTLALGLLFWAFHLAVPAKPPERMSLNSTPLEPYMPAHMGRVAGGGGGGGDASKLQASAGTPPKATMKQQLAPPTVIVQNQQPKIVVPPTIVADLKVPVSAQIGDPLSKLVAPSNGAGVGSGVGSGSGGGLGSGDGRGLGPGSGANFGGGVFRVGNGVSPPRPIFQPDPDYSDEARKVKHQGVVVLSVTVGADGRVYNPTVARSLGMGLDEKAKEKVLTWKFEPATKDGKPVPVLITVEVSFNLY